MAAPAAAAESDLVQLPRGTTYQLLEDADRTEIRIPITVSDGVTSANLTVNTLDVALGQLEQPGLAEAFVPKLTPAENNRGAALVITVAAPHGLRAGTYNLLLAIRRPASKGSTAAEQRLQLQLAHPAAQLQAPSTLIVQRTRWLPFLDAVNTAPATLSLRETTRESRVGSPAGDLTIQQQDAAESGNDPISGRLRFDKTSPVPAGRIAEQQFMLDESFPLGTATGTLLVSAPQLQSPVAVNFEVRTRLSSLWIVLVAVLGLLIGWSTRIYLTNRIALVKAQEQAYELLEKIDRELARRPDEDFQHEVLEAREMLVSKVNDPVPQNIVDATTAANTKLQGELDELEQRRTQEQTKIDTLAKDLRYAWALPPGMREVLEDASTQLAEAERLLVSDNVKAAKKKRERLESDVRADLRQAAEAWREPLTPLLDELISPERRIDASVAASLKASAEQVQQLTTDDPNVGLDQLLRAFQTAQRGVNRILDRLLILREIAVKVADILETAGPADPEAVTAIRKAVEKLEVPAPGTEFNRERASGLADAITELHAAMSQAVERELTQLASAEDRKEVLKRLDEGRYREAAEIAVSRRPPEERALGVEDAVQVARVTDMVGTSVQALLSRVAAEDGSRVSPDHGLSLFVTRDRESALTVRLYKTRQARERAQLIQVLLLAIVFSVIAYLLYEPTFAGTINQLGAIFLWAFASDLAVGAVVTSAQRAAPAPSPNQGAR